jgi:hypothetical protein
MKKKIQHFRKDITPQSNHTNPGKPGDMYIGLCGSLSCREYIENLLSRADRLVLIGIEMTLLNSGNIAQHLFSRAAKKDTCSIELYLGNPLSPDIETRLIEEKLGQQYLKDTTPRVGKSGLIERIHALITIWEENNKSPDVLIRCFNHYLTFLLFIIETREDKTYLFSPYGCARPGTESPMLQFLDKDNDHKDMTVFFEKQYERIKNTSIPAHDVIKVYHRDYTEKDSLYTFALYFVPGEDSDFFNYGTKVLGYNCYTGRETGSVYREYNKKSKKFGFHMTICDALYFTGGFEICKIENEIAYMWKEFKDIELSDLRIKKNSPDKGTISVTLNDRSGKLEAFHHELVHRVYKVAAGSDYTLGISGRSGRMNTERDRFMIRRYNAPFILSRFTPHFTLLTDIPQDRINDIYTEIRTQFFATVQLKSMTICELSIMERKPDGFWKITKKI